MSIKNIFSEIASFAKDTVKIAAEDVLKDLVKAQNLDPVVLVADSALEAATTDDSFQERVVHNAKEGFQAMGRLGEKIGRLSERGISLFWQSQSPSLPTVVRDLPLSREASQKKIEELLQYAEPSKEDFRQMYQERMRNANSEASCAVSEPNDGRPPLDKIMERAGVTPEEFTKDCENYMAERKAGNHE